MFFETLENRSLFSVSLNAGILTVTGTNLSDAITVNKNASGQLSVNDDGTVHNYNWASVSEIIVNALGGNDVVTSYNTMNKPMVIHGGDGNDVLRGGAGNDVITGDNGDDWIDGRQGNDDEYGGAGVDTADYSDRTANLSITLDDVNNDGGPGGHDNIHSDFENVLGGSGNDYIVGDGASNYLAGNGGNDAIYGGGGSDVLDGGAGDDVLSLGVGNGTATGDDGADVLYGGSGAGTNYLYGGVGNDSIYGYGNQNVMYGGAGNDFLNSFGSGTTWEYGDAGDDAIYGGYGQNVIHGGDGNDVLHGYSANTNWVYGEAGDDVIYAGSGQNVLDGGDGNDQIHGGGTGTNWIYGGAGNDKLIGGSTGTSYIYGGAGDDQLYAGQGYSYLSGDDGADILVSVGGSHYDNVYGGAGFDSFWVDAESTETTPDASIIETVLGTVHRVGSFGNGASRDRLGQNVADPNDCVNPVYFNDKPLFATDGPTKDDIFQGGVGDCYFLATLGATAKTNPNRIRQSVVELGDGTYAVQFWSGNTPVFERVDGQLPTDGYGNLSYAKLGHQSSTWVAVMEKAFTYFRTGADSYASIASGWMSEVFSDLHTTSTNLWSWSNGGSLLGYIQGELAAGKAVTIGTPSTINNGCPCIGSHAYMVDHVNFTTINVPFIGAITFATSVTLRNPWGYDGTGNDGNTADGYVTVSADQANSNFTAVMSAFV